jgi:hypothetical protein
LVGIAAISISHLQYYSSMVEWAEAFGAPIHLHGADLEWVMRPSDRIVFWEGETRELDSGLTLVRWGGPGRHRPPVGGGCGEERRGEERRGEERRGEERRPPLG